MLAPSKATPTGFGPAGNSVGTVFALYHFNSATFSGFDNGGAPEPVGSPAFCVCPSIKLAKVKTSNTSEIPTKIRFMILYLPRGNDSAKPENDSTQRWNSKQPPAPERRRHQLGGAYHGFLAGQAQNGCRYGFGTRRLDKAPSMTESNRYGG